MDFLLKEVRWDPLGPSLRLLENCADIRAGLFGDYSIEVAHHGYEKAIDILSRPQGLSTLGTRSLHNSILAIAGDLSRDLSFAVSIRSSEVWATPSDVEICLDTARGHH